MAKSESDIVGRALASAADRAQARADREKLEAQVSSVCKETGDGFNTIAWEVGRFVEESGEQWDHSVGDRYYEGDWMYNLPRPAWVRFEDTMFHLSSTRVIPGIRTIVGWGVAKSVWLNTVVHRYSASIVERDIVVTIMTTYRIEYYTMEYSSFYGGLTKTGPYSFRTLQRDFTRTYDVETSPQKLHTKEQMVRLVADMVSDAQRNLLFAPDNNTRPSGYVQACDLLAETGWKAGPEQWGGAFTPLRESPCYQWWGRFLKWMGS